MVDRVVEDMKKGRRGSYPSSRFTTRMIPIQATCFAGLEEIQYAVESLVSSIILSITNSEAASSSTDGEHPKKKKGTTTFAIQTKRRICGHLKREQIIEAVGQQVAKSAPDWTVNLSEPDYTVIVEICKNLAGISVVPSSSTATAEGTIGTSRTPPFIKNFNLAELRTQIALPSDDDDEGEE